MKKYIFLLAFLSACGPARESDKIEYPFADACAPEIDQYCSEYEREIGNCMFDHFENLGHDCSDAVFYFAGGEAHHKDKNAFIKNI